VVLVKVGEIENDLGLRSASLEGPAVLLLLTHVRNKASLQHTKQGTAGKKRAAPRQPELAGGDETPENHLRRDPAIGANPLGNQLGRELGAEEGELEDGISEVVICSDTRTRVSDTFFRGPISGLAYHSYSC